MAWGTEEQHGKMGRSLAEESYHRYASNGNSSRNARTIADVAAARYVSKPGRRGRKQRFPWKLLE
jgi:hypothetical protein